MNALTHTFTIETDVALPPHPRPGKPVRSAVRLAVEALRTAPDGGSIFIPAAVFSGLSGRPIWRVSQTAALYGTGWFACRSTDGGVRIWRLTEPTREVARRYGKAAA